MNKNLNKNKTENYFRARITEVRKSIAALTNNWMPVKKKYDQYELQVDHFNTQYTSLENETVNTKVFWGLLLLSLPVMLGVDYAGIKDFFEFLGSKLGGLKGQWVKEFGFIVFLLIELVVGGAYVTNINNEKEGRGITGFKGLFINLLMIAIIIMPAAIIIMGYVLDEAPTTKKLEIAAILTGVSFLIHLTIYLAIENVIKAITYYMVYLRRAAYFRFINPEGRLIEISENLKMKYIDFDDVMGELGEYEDQKSKLINYKLGKIETWLKNKLENTVDYTSIYLSDLNESNLTGTTTIFTPSKNGNKVDEKITVTE